jgi:hypothetical protein
LINLQYLYLQQRQEEELYENIPPKLRSEVTYSLKVQYLFNALFKVLLEKNIQIPIILGLFQALQSSPAKKDKEANES